jgi:EAL domain-containing protein (putative c-di-GMP-specific phosphodiesterase class I)
MSSFGYLRHLDVDYVKIDGGFVRGMSSDPVNRAMVEMINRIGKIMGKITIAESVEQIDTIQALREIGVDDGQGYALHAPVPLAALLAERTVSTKGFGKSKRLRPPKGTGRQSIKGSVV